jgi:hypothetical protein
MPDPDRLIYTPEHQPAAMGIAGVNTRPLQEAALGIAGHWGSTLRPRLGEVISPVPPLSSRHLGDRAARECWRRAVYLLDYTYISCPTRPGSGAMRYRDGFHALCAPETRALPLYLDSGGFREFVGTAPPWSSYRRYCHAIDLVRPEGAMAKDVIGDQQGSREGYERMCADGYRDLAIPVWQARPAWLGHLDASANGREAAQDPILRSYCHRAPLVGIGGLVQGPCPREERHRYLEQLCTAFPDTRFWALGQASATVVNGLGSLGLLDRIWTDGSWWIHHARTEQIAVVQDGLLKSLRLTHTGARSFFTLPELMAANLRSLLSAYSGLWSFPGPPRVPEQMHDLDERVELRRRVREEVGGSLVRQLPLEL